MARRFDSCSNQEKSSETTPRVEGLDNEVHEYFQEYNDAASQVENATYNDAKREGLEEEEEEVFVERENDFFWSSDEVEEIEDPPDLVDRGVSIELLIDLLIDHDLKDMTTRQVVENFVLPQTADYGCSLAGLMKRSFPETVGRATHYIIHPWDANFGRLVEALKQVDESYRMEHGKASFWIDIFAVDQHLHLDGYEQEGRVWLHRDQLLANVRNCIESIDHACVFIEPTYDPILLTRSWCLFETMHALYHERRLHLITCSGDRSAVSDFMVENVAEIIRAFTPNFNASKTWSKVDKDWLLTAVIASHPTGLQGLEESVGHVMLEWLAKEISYQVSHLEEDMMTPVRALYDLSQLLESLGNIHEAQAQYTRALDIARSTLGFDHPLTLAIAHHLACAEAKHFFKFGEAEELLMDTLENRERILGKTHPDTIESVLALARLRQALGRLAEAEPLFRRALQNYIVSHGFAHRDTLVAANLLALLLQEQGCLQEAHVLLTRTLQEGKRMLGSTHVDVLMWRNNMAVLIQDKEELAQAETLFRRVLTDSERTLGPDHPQTLNIVHNLGQCLWQQEKNRAAENLFKRELAGCDAMFGTESRETQRSIRNLVDFFSSLGREEDAEEFSQRLISQ